MNRIDLAGRTAIVTGAVKGIGRAITAHLQAAGAQVIAWDIDADGLAAMADTVAGNAVVDIADGGQVRAAVETAVNAHGRLDILINNAGIVGPPTAALAYPEDAWRQVVDIDLTGTFLCCQAVAPQMVAAGYGRIVNIASIAGKEGTPMLAAYSAAKAGVIAFTKVLGRELAETGVIANCVAPAAIETDMAHNQDPEVLRLMIEKNPMKRLGTVDEVARMTAWLASADCSFSTGAVFDLSGGRAGH
ncbi:MAG: SDR family NAD(P)-dependent oxidoreductase [Pseudomonadota bacterium]|nr:SDR family NAD(P)-dependent oxidoreductase [Pseudomonadota bacterium]MEC8054114.1 SDR family NAD(P)-dependent oxidoreductase [Pseudomonadota bacterium]MEC8062196.1 SDR family NAD(P)-dependent oxidoreductase [Pseudomonadota bacterium]MEC8675811.1 SDR family NAD(P)-dependent oxidoreductase [Pseudomonadota bacterium]MEC9165678.1 SDR family NAD(P)-dependent oxidoreductase [Pseudomonadota bacterium]